MSKGRFRLHLTFAARRDIAAIGRYTDRAFGEVAERRYSALISQALRDIQDDPDRPGAKARPGISPEFCFYHLSLSRQRTVAPVVKAPRHFIVYRKRRDDVIEIVRVLHDSRDLVRHLPGGAGSG